MGTMMWKQRRRNDDVETTTWERWHGNDGMGTMTWEWWHGKDNMEMTAWKCDVETMMWEQWCGNDDMGMTMWKWRRGNNDVKMTTWERRCGNDHVISKSPKSHSKVMWLTRLTNQKAPFVQISNNFLKLKRICEISSKISLPFKEQSCWNSSANKVKKWKVYCWFIRNASVNLSFFLVYNFYWCSAFMQQCS